MLSRLIELWGVNKLGLIALEYRTNGVDEELAEIYAEHFHDIHSDFYIELLEVQEGVGLDTYYQYLCCTMGDGNPIAIEAAVPLTSEQLEKFSTISEDFYAVINSILTDGDVIDE